MRTIKKILPCHALAERNKRPPTNHLKATFAWNRFRRHKPSVTRTCYQEQFGLCCYSEISLDNVFSILRLDNTELSRALGTHIEHIEPKSRNPRKTFEYTNLILSAIDDPSKRNLLKVDVFGGHAKQKMYHATSFISPLLNNCSQYFHYETSGKVVPKASLPTQREKAKARLTIYMLNLNSPILVEWRKVWLTELSKIIDESSIQALEHIADAELGPTNNLLRPFHSAQKQMFGAIGTRVCEKYNI